MDAHKGLAGVRSVKKATIYTISPSYSVQSAAGLMAGAGVAFLPVEHRPVGAIKHSPRRTDNDRLTNPKGSLLSMAPGSWPGSCHWKTYPARIRCWVRAWSRPHNTAVTRQASLNDAFDAEYPEKSWT